MKELAHSSRRPRSPSEGGDVEALVENVIVEDDGVSLRDYWRGIRRRLWLIAIFPFGTVFATVLVLLMMTPIYTAETTLLIERRAPQVLKINDAFAESLVPDEYDFYRTQYEILKSKAIAARVIRDQGLEANALFTTEGKQDFVASFWAKVRAWPRRFFPSAPETNGENPFDAEPELSNMGVYFQMLEIKPIQRTRLVKIAFSTPDGVLSARVANAHAQAYIRKGLELRTEANEEALRFLEEKLVELKGMVGKSDAVLSRYRRDKGIISLDDKENTVVQRLDELNRRLTEAEIDRIALEAQVRLIRKRNYETLPAVINSTLIGTLKGELARLEVEYADLSRLFKSGHPRLGQLQAQVEESRRQLRQEIHRVVAGIESSYLAAQAKEKALREEMEEQKAAALSLKDDSVEYAILARDVDTNRQLYDGVLQRMNEMAVAAELRPSNVSVIDRAKVPLVPSAPKKGLNILLSALVGLMGGVGLVCLFEYLDNTLKTPEDVERYLRLPNLGVVPDFLTLNRRRYAPQVIPRSLPQTPGLELMPFHHPFSVAAETYRALRTAILLSRAGDPPRTILFTSGTPGEGKTTTMINTAFMFARTGARVLAIDADVRHPNCHRVLRMENGPGLTELLTGHREPEEAIKPTALDGLFLLSSGSLSPNPTELLGSQKMQDTLASLQEHYSYILIDSPPVLPVSDAVLLSTMVDGVVLVVNSQMTPKQVVEKTRSRLMYARAKVLGVVLNRVNIPSGDYAYDSHRYYSFPSSGA